MKKLTAVLPDLRPFSAGHLAAGQAPVRRPGRRHPRRRPRSRPAASWDFTLAVARDGKIVLPTGYGLASLADRRPVTEETMFAIGSVTKQFTCACILLLAEDGKLSPHGQGRQVLSGPDPGRRDHDPRPDEPRLRISGLLSPRLRRPPDGDAPARRRGHPALRDGQARLRAGHPLFLFQHRVRSSSAASSRRSPAMPFGEFLSRRILKPLGLEHTTYEPDTAGDTLRPGLHHLRAERARAGGPRRQGLGRRRRRHLLHGRRPRPLGPGPDVGEGPQARVLQADDLSPEARGRPDVQLRLRALGRRPGGHGRPGP